VWAVRWVNPTEEILHLQCSQLRRCLERWAASNGRLGVEKRSLEVDTGLLRVGYSSESIYSDKVHLQCSQLRRCLECWVASDGRLGVEKRSLKVDTGLLRVGK